MQVRSKQHSYILDWGVPADAAIQQINPSTNYSTSSC